MIRIKERSVFLFRAIFLLMILISVLYTCQSKYVFLCFNFHLVLNKTLTAMIDFNHKQQDESSNVAQNRILVLKFF